MTLPAQHTEGAASMLLANRIGALFWRTAALVVGLFSVSQPAAVAFGMEISLRAHGHMVPDGLGESAGSYAATETANAIAP